MHVPVHVKKAFENRCHHRLCPVSHHKHLCHFFSGRRKPKYSTSQIATDKLTCDDVDFKPHMKPKTDGDGLVNLLWQTLDFAFYSSTVRKRRNIAAFVNTFQRWQSDDKLFSIHLQAIRKSRVNHLTQLLPPKAAHFQRKLPHSDGNILSIVSPTLLMLAYLIQK